MVSTPSPAPSDDLRPQAWRWLRRCVQFALGLVAALWLLLLAAWLALHWLILPHADDWRGAVEAYASRALGAPVRIGHLDIDSAGWRPSLDLRGLQLYDPQGREALRLERVRATLSPRSLLAGQLRFSQVVVDGARLELQRDADGRLRVAGFAWDAAAAGDRRLRDWVLAQPELAIRDARVVWTDATRSAPPLALQDVDLVLRSRAQHHALRVDATLPPQWGGRASLRGRFTQPLLATAAELQRWSGTLYLELAQADVAQLLRFVALPFELRAGDGALRAWAELRGGQARQLTLDLALRTLELRLAPALQPLALEQLQGRFVADRDADGVALAIRALRFETGDALHWPASELRIALQQAQDLGSWPPSAAAVTGGEFSADRLDLDVIARTTARLPVGAALRGLLHTVAPRGTLRALQGSWQGPIDAPSAYRVSGRIAGLDLAAGVHGATAGRPGLRGAQLAFDASERGGKAELALHRGALIFPGVWAQPQLDFDQLEAKLAWQIDPVAGAAPAIAVQVSDARFANAHAQGEFDARWTTGAGAGSGKGGRYPGRIELSGRLQRADASQVARYLPLVVPQTVRDYLAGALLGGRFDAATVRLRGDLWSFPFADPRDGEFKVRAQARDLSFAYVPGSREQPSSWPPFTRVAGELEFDRYALRLRGVRAALWGYELRELRGGIADLSADEPVLRLEGRGHGPAADLLRYLRSTPLAEWVGPAVGGIGATGDSDLKLALVLPLAQPEQVELRGSVQLPGNELRLRADWPVLRDARGGIDFSERDWRLRDARARVFGGELRFDGGSGADGALHLSARGSATADALRDAPAPVAQLAPRLRGQASYQASFDRVDGVAQLRLDSDLVGLRLDLPAPLAKPAASAWPLRVQARLPADPKAADARELLQLDLAEVLKARFERSAASGRVQRGSVAVGAALPPLPAAGVTAALQLGQVDVDAWAAVQTQFGRTATAAVDAGFVPGTIALRADELRSGQRRITHVVADLQHELGPDASRWRAQGYADQLDGRIELRLPRGPAQGARAGQITARLRRLAVPPADVAGVEELLRAPPKSVPALDVVIDDFELRGRKLGRLQVQAVNRVVPGGSGAVEWQLDTLQLRVPEAQLDASGRWQAGAGQQMRLDFQLALADSGALAERLGAGAVLRGGKGQAQGQLRWAGSPLALDAASVEGQLNLALQAGQILQADPGAARLLGVFSLQALPRRLTLDFRDLFQQGFAFDEAGGDFRVERGIARTENLRLQGVQATVLVHGSADLQRETQDLQVLVVPRFDGAGVALATMVINPAIGFGTLLAQWALREPLIAANTREYHVTGPWAEPKVQPVLRSTAGPAPVAPPAPPAPPVTPPTPEKRPTG